MPTPVATITMYRDSGVLTGGHGTTRGSAEGGYAFGRSEDGLTVIPIPTATGTHFSWETWLYLWCSAGGGTTHISNKKVQLASAIATGLHEWFRAVAAGSYVQPAAVAAADAGANGATPGSDTEIVSASATVFESTSVAAANSAMASEYCVAAIGVDNSFAGGGGSSALPTLNMIYDEGP